jgi:hypothetical protein
MSVTAIAVSSTPRTGMMLDCGDRWSEQTFWTPSLHYFAETIDALALLNLDEDHISDFDGMMQNCAVPWILSNPTVGPNEFAVLKKGRRS